MKTIMNENYYDANEISSLLGLSLITVRKYVRNRKINAVKIGKSWYAKETDLKEYLKSNNNEKAPGTE
jgi:excisionase family DNA binding protein